MSEVATKARASAQGAPPLDGLVERAAAGDQQAARALFERFQDSVMGYCVLSCNGDRDAAKDLTQEAFIKVFQNLDQVDDPRRFASWLWTIVRRTCASHGSRRSRYTEILDLFAVDRQVVLAGEDKNSRERRILCVQRVLDEVEDETMARIAELKYTEPEHTTREIARKLDIPHGTVTVKLMRFRERIEARLARELERLDESQLRGETP